MRVMVGPMRLGCQVIGYTSYTQNQGTNNFAGCIATNFIANSFYTLFPMKRSLRGRI